ncbi:MAG: deoxyuridine 5'-triphosphate nucleotidohydrolase [Candidatus Micrarchaeota archaeon]|nr:deoxyuridine 5'-triphosphate nucleotidohydrolase [Candidatus Micrarchaeota archaeon]
MLLEKGEIMRRGAVSEFIGDGQFQPCGVDLTLREVHSLESGGSIDFDNKERKLSETKKIDFDGEWVHLKKGAYKIVYNEIVSIPPDCAGMALPRSSLLRCGAFVHCALWDPGYRGRSESLLVVENEKGIKLKKNARVVQLVLVRLEKPAKELYEGKYKNENVKL